MKQLAAVFICVLGMVPSFCQAFVFETPHLLYLVSSKIKEPVGIEAEQSRMIMGTSEDGSGVMNVREKLIYDFPGRFRSEVMEGPVSGFTVISDDGFIKVMDSQVVSETRSPVACYTDILLYRDYESLLAALERVGIDTTRVSFHRYNGKICYVVGAPAAGLWIDKETLFPIKYVVRKNGWTVECFYDAWQRVSKTWYPMRGSIFLDGRLFSMIQVDSFTLKSQNQDSLFDVVGIRQAYQTAVDSDGSTEASQVDELNRRIETFKKLYE